MATMVNQCHICFDGIDVEANIQVHEAIPHTFHKTCLQAWFEESQDGTCPLCHQPVVEDALLVSTRAVKFVEAGHIEKLESIIDDVSPKLYLELVKIGIDSRNLAMVDFLVKNLNSPDQDLENENAAVYSIGKNDIEMLKYFVDCLLARGVKITSSLWEVAGQCGDVPCTQFLETIPGIDTAGGLCAALYHAVEFGRVELVRYIAVRPGIDVSDRHNLLVILAASSGCISIVEFLMNFTGVDPMARGGTALYIAAARGNLEGLVYLLSIPGYELESMDVPGHDIRRLCMGNFP